MMELELGGRRTPIPTGELTLGGDPSCSVRLEGLSGIQAIVIGAVDGSVSVRRIGDSDILLNGVRLGADPAPMLHGDKLQVGGHDLFLHDPRRSGSTQFVSASDLARMVEAAQKPSTPKPATAATGGRLVSLTDGREYTIGSIPLVFGREAGCEIVVPNKDVSRRHAEIVASAQGYLLIDSSTNGTFVNGERIEGQRILARSDIIRVGDNDFRFYADKAAEPPGGGAQVPLTPAPIEPAAPLPPAPPPPTGAAVRLSHTMHGLPVPPPVAPPRPVARASGASLPMATFLVRSGSLKGERLTVRVPVVNIGRADYNDLVLPEESVSGTHAKLTRREGVWVLSDLGSTNGTFIDGERLSGDAPLSPGNVVRFGDVSLMFDPTDDHLGTTQGTGTKVMGAIRVEGTVAPAPPAAAPAPPSPAAVAPASPPPLAPPAAQPAPAPRPAPRPPVLRPGQVVVSSPPKSAVPGWLVPAVVVAILAALVYFFVVK
ncbi:MAG: FHA domain-containing protein [Gemmatimonadota bacterium]|nr:FHA domain-containing protein [Gemmatimonadota bacterium]